jgi:hypothetical protein
MNNEPVKSNKPEIIRVNTIRVLDKSGQEVITKALKLYDLMLLIIHSKILLNLDGEVKTATAILDCGAEVDVIYHKLVPINMLHGMERLLATIEEATGTEIRAFGSIQIPTRMCDGKGKSRCTCSDTW